MGYAEKISDNFLIIILLYKFYFMKRQYKKYAEFAKDYEMILCNEIEKIEPYLFENIIVWDLYDEDGEMKDIFQFYFIAVWEYDLKYIANHYPDVIIARSEMLDVYVLLVDHVWTSWDYVDTEFTP